MKRKTYEEPTMQVVQLKQQPQLLAGSVGASRGDYGNAIIDDWSEDAPAPANIPGINIPGIDNNILFE